MIRRPMDYEPPVDCQLCPRLKGFREENRLRFPEFHNGAVASFGTTDAELLILGLAPGLKGANQSGRPFTGDYAGELLYPSLLKHEFAFGSYEAHPDDGLQLIGCRISNAVRSFSLSVSRASRTAWQRSWRSRETSGAATPTHSLTGARSGDCSKISDRRRATLIVSKA